MTLREALAFVVGAALGAGVTYLYIREKYRQVAQDEIDSMKAHYNSQKEEEVEEKKVEDNHEEVERYKNIVEDKYVKGEPSALPDPYPITEEQFDETRLDFDKVYLTYYGKDATLAEDEDIIFEDIDYYIGLKNLDLFDDRGIIYIRNEKHGTDYQVDYKDAAYPQNYSPEDE